MESNQKQTNCKPKPGLYIVATPMGNLGDVSARALELLGSVDIIYCEDTRVTGKLLKQFGIASKTSVYNDHSGERVREGVLKRLREGEAVALVSDAGTPLISDPGFKLVRDVREEGIDVFAVPGSCAAVAALSISGLPTDQFVFLGFLPKKDKDINALLTIYTSLPQSLVIYESPKRIKKTVQECMSVLGEDRKACVARELTKKFEQTAHGTLAALQSRLGDDIPEKGEFVLVIGPPEKQAQALESFDAVIQVLLEANRPLKEIVEMLCALHPSFSRNAIYDRAQQLKHGND